MGTTNAETLFAHMIDKFSSLEESSKVKSELGNILAIDWCKASASDFYEMHDLIYQVSSESLCVLLSKSLISIESKGKELRDSFILCSILELPSVEELRLRDQLRKTETSFAEQSIKDMKLRSQYLSALSVEQTDILINVVIYLIEKGKKDVATEEEGIFESELTSLYNQLLRHRSFFD